MVACLQQGADVYIAQLLPLPMTDSCFSKIEIGFTVLVPAHPDSPGQKAIKQVCVCVCDAVGCRSRVRVRWVRRVGPAHEHGTLRPYDRPVDNAGEHEHGPRGRRSRRRQRPALLCRRLRRAQPAQLRRTIRPEHGAVDAHRFHVHEALRSV